MLNCGAQVTLYEGPTATLPLNADFQLTMDEPLVPGLQVAAYFAEEHNSAAFVGRVRSAVADVVAELAAVQVEYSSHCSTVIYLKVLGALSKELLVGHIVNALQRSGEATIVLIKCSPDCVFEVQKGKFALRQGASAALQCKKLYMTMRQWHRRWIAAGAQASHFAEGALCRNLP